MADLTLILDALHSGEPPAAGALLAQVYAELRQLARTKMAREQPGQTLQPTALMHEAWLKLVERARSKGRDKRGAGAEHVDVDDIEIAAPGASDDELLAVHEALDRFAAQDPRRAELVKLRYFSGLTFEDVAEFLGISVATANRDWAYARAWLHQDIAAAAK